MFTALAFCVGCDSAGGKLRLNFKGNFILRHCFAVWLTPTPAMQRCFTTTWTNIQSVQMTPWWFRQPRAVFCHYGTHTFEAPLHNLRRCREKLKHCAFQCDTHHTHFDRPKQVTLPAGSEIHWKSEELIAYSSTLKEKKKFFLIYWKKDKSHQHCSHTATIKSTSPYRVMWPLQLAFRPHGVRTWRWTTVSLRQNILVVDSGAGDSWANLLATASCSVQACV